MGGVLANLAMVPVMSVRTRRSSSRVMLAWRFELVCPCASQAQSRSRPTWMICG
jgi:hypothetical protein